MQPHTPTRPILRPYQIVGVDALLKLDRDCLLADEPGLGKTAQTAEYINRTRPDKVLIVCPASLRLNWQRELDTWMVHQPGATSVASYESVVRAPRMQTPTYDLIVFDEAHYLKNPKAQRTKACLALKARRRLFLTGTPIVNRPMDLYPILSSIGIKLSYKEYGTRYCAGHLIPIQWKPTKRYAWDFSGASHTDELNRLLRRSVMVRRTKQEVLSDLPKKIRQVIEINAPHGESRQLRDAVNRMFDSFTRADAGNKELKQLAFEELSAARLETAQRKLPHILDYLKLLLDEEEKVVVFAYHREIIDQLETELAEFSPVKLYGGMTDRQKNSAVETFQNGSARVFIGQLTAAGTGLTLTAASTCLFAELDWVPGNVIQCEDRIHRFGQQLPCRIIHIVLRDSVDGRMVRALVAKQKTIEGAMK